MTPSLNKANCIVIKIGSALLYSSKTGALRSAWLDALTDDIAALRAEGKQVVIVTSGAVALGRSVMQLDAQALPLTLRQAAAACGQPILLNAWARSFARHNISVGQNLLTAEDSENRRRYINARNTLQAMLANGIVPIVNENDTVTTAEIRYGDNDRLAARVTAMVKADTLVLLSDIDGLYSADPSKDSDATHIPLVEKIDDTILAMASDATDHISSGGMKTKLTAAQIATQSGCHMVIAKGTEPHPIRALQHDARCSWFLAKTNPASARKQWIAASQSIEGGVQIDAGASRALQQGKSLLAAGITAVEGGFSKGGIIWIKTPEGTLIGKGICAYDAQDVAHIAGQSSDAFEALLGFIGPNEIVHRDDLVLESPHG